MAIYPGPTLYPSATVYPGMEEPQVPVSEGLIDLDADTLGAVGSTVSSWVDLATSRPFTQANAPSQPQVVAGPNGHKAVKFSDTWLTSDSAAAGGKAAVTVAFVMRLDAVGPYPRMGIVSAVPVAGGNDYQGPGWSIATSAATSETTFESLVLSGSATQTNDPDVKSSSHPLGQWVIVVGQMSTDGQVTQFYTNGTAETANTAGGSGTLTLESLFLGARKYGGNVLDFSRISIAAMRVYDGRLTSAQRATLDSAWSDKYGITVSDYVASPKTGSVTTSGSGTVALTGKPGATNTLAVSGSGTVALTGKPGAKGTRALSGSGTAAFTGKPGAKGTWAPSGSGTVALSGTAAVSVAFSGSVALSGSGTVALSGKAAPQGTLAPSGTGTVTLTGVPGPRGTLALSGLGIATFSGGSNRAGALPLSGSGTVALTAAALTAKGTSAPAGSGSVALTGAAVTARGSIALSGSGSLALSAPVAYSGSVALSGSGSVALARRTLAAGSISLAGSGSLALAYSTAQPFYLARTSIFVGSGSGFVRSFCPGDTVPASIVSALGLSDADVRLIYA